MSESSNSPVGASAVGAQVLPFEPRPADRVEDERVYIVSSTATAGENRTSKFDVVKFDRAELDLMLGAYGRRVATGEWRDYAIDMLKDRAVFSIFRRSAEMPIYRIEKNPRLARRQGVYSIVSAEGTVLKRGHDLRQVMRVLDRKSKVVPL
ncbi:MAG: DUF2794 domain-containing protein [Pseudomonadota bacterium]